MVVVHSRHSAVYAHILYGGGWYIGTNGSCWILQSLVHYIPPVSVARYLPARLISIHLACGLAWQKAQPSWPIFCCLKAQSLLFNSYSLSVYCSTLSPGGFESFGHEI